MLDLSRTEIEALVEPDRVVRAIEAGYMAASSGEADLPAVGYLRLPDSDGDCHIKYGHIKGDPVFVIKIATGFYGNSARGLPTSNGMMIAISAETGAVEAILHDEGTLTDLRTGYGGAIATRALCRPGSRRVAVIGTGTQARQQIRALRALMPEAELAFAAWGRSPGKVDELVRDMASEGIAVSAATDLERLCRGSDVIVTTTPSRQPIIRSDWIAAGTHITAVGADAPSKQELDVALVARADRRVADSLAQCLDHGEFAAAARHGLIAGEDCVELGQVLAGTAAGRRAADDITIADLTGLAVQDIAITRAVLDAWKDRQPRPAG